MKLFRTRHINVVTVRQINFHFQLLDKRREKIVVFMDWCDGSHACLCNCRYCADSIFI